MNRYRGLSGNTNIPRRSETVTGIAAISVKYCQLVLDSMIQANPAINTDPIAQKAPIEDNTFPLELAGINSANKSYGITTPPIPTPQRVRSETKQIRFGEKELPAPARTIIRHAIDINHQSDDSDGDDKDDSRQKKWIEIII